MDNLLFTVLIIALLYYFFYYLPHKKLLNSEPLTQTISTQTEPLKPDNLELEPILDELIKEIRKLNHAIK